MGFRSRFSRYLILSTALVTLVNAVYNLSPGLGIAFTWPDMWGILFYAEIVVFAGLLEYFYRSENREFKLEIWEDYKDYIVCLLGPWVLVFYSLGLINIPAMALVLSVLIDGTAALLVALMAFLGMYAFGAYQLLNLISRDRKWTRRFYIVLSISFLLIELFVLLIAAITPPT